MFGGLLTFLFLYGLIAVFEKGRDDLDTFSIAAAVAVPIIAMIIIRITGYFIGLGPWTDLLAVITLIVATYLMLSKNLEISAKKSAAFTAAVFAFNVALSVGYVFFGDAG